jgi:hypothetical protein
MKKKIEPKQKERRMLRLNLDEEILEKFEILCIQKKIKKFHGAEEALREWIEKRS